MGRAAERYRRAAHRLFDGELTAGELLSAMRFARAEQMDIITESGARRLGPERGPAPTTAQGEKGPERV